MADLAELADRERARGTDSRVAPVPGAGDVVNPMAERIMGLQRLIGNRNVTQLLQVQRQADGGGVATLPGPRPLVNDPLRGTISGDLTPPTPRPLVRRGDEGPTVEELQIRLNEDGADPLLVVDGDFAGATDAAVRAFQGRHGCKVDGIVGPQTWGLLDELDRADIVGPHDQGGSGVVQFIDVHDGALLTSFPGAGFSWGRTSEPFSADGRLIFDGGSIRDTTSGEIVSKPSRSASPADADFSADGALIVVSEGRANRATVYSVLSGDEVTSVITEDYMLICAEFFPDGERLLLPGLIGHARIWDMANDKELLAISLGDSFVLLSPDGRFIAVNDEANHRLVDAATGDVVLALSGRIAAFSPDGSRLAEHPGNDTTRLAIWNVLKGTKSAEFAVDATIGVGVPYVSFNADGSRVVAVRDGVAEIHDTTSGGLVSTLHLDEGEILNASYSPDGTQIVTANSIGTVRIWPAP